MTRRVCTGLVCLLLAARPAFAQRDRLLLEPPPPIHWGIIASFTPSWNMPDHFKTLITDPPEADVEGSDFTIGFVRARPLGADWGVSFVRKKFQQTSYVTRFDFEGSTTYYSRFVARDVSAVGGQVHLAVPFNTIRDRVQIGLYMAGGMGSLVGEFDQHRARVLPTTLSVVPPPVGPEVVSPHSTKGVFFPSYDDLKLFPLGEIDLTVGVIASNRFKMRVGGGFNYPGITAFNVSVMYLFPRATP